MLTAQQLAMRQGGIGGSDISVILGLLDKYGTTRADLLREKAGLVEPSPPPPMKIHFGNAMEPAIIEWLRIEYGWTITASDTIYHPAKRHLFCHPDGLIASVDCRIGPGMLECKNSRYQAKTGPPDYHEAQIRWNIGIAGYAWGVLAVLVGGCDVLTTFYEHDDAIFSKMVEEADRFWVEVQALKREVQ